MKAILKINEVEKSYPQEISDLESLISFVMTGLKPKEEFIFEVKIDGERFSEVYEHQAKEMNLGKIEIVEIGAQTKEAMARSFLKLAPVLMDDLETAFGSTISLLRIPQKEENGHDMLAMSLETLHALKSHLEDVWNVLGRPDKLVESSLLWEKFDNLADMIVINQERKNAMNIASLLEERVPAFLGEWKKTIEVKEERSNLGPALQLMKTKPVEELAARA